MKRSGIKRNPDKVREWVDKSRSALERKKPLNPISPNRVAKFSGYDYAEFVWLVCMVRERGGSYRSRPCVVCGRRSEDAHHAIPKQRLKAIGAKLGMSAEGVGRLLMDERNGVALCRQCHDGHEAAAKRIQRRALPPSVWTFARYLDKRLGTEECMTYLERIYQ